MNFWNLWWHFFGQNRPNFWAILGDFLTLGDLKFHSNWLVTNWWANPPMAFAEHVHQWKCYPACLHLHWFQITDFCLSRALASLVNPTFKWSYAILKLKVFVQYIYRFPAIPGTNFLGKIWCFWLHLNNRHSKSDVFGSMWRRHTRAAACTQLDLAHTIRWFCTFQFCTREREKKFFFLANFAKICPPKWSHAQSYLKVHTSVTRLGYFWEVLAAIFLQSSQNICELLCLGMLQ